MLACSFFTDLCKRCDSACARREPAHGCCRGERFGHLTRQVANIGRRCAAGGQLFSDRMFIDGLYWRRGSRYGRCMRGSLCGSLSLSLSIIAAAQLVLLPASRAQNAPAPGEPEVNTQGNNVAPPPPMPGPPVPPGPPGPPPAYGPIVTVRSDHPRARLQVQGPLKWQDVCVAPCNVPVNPQGLYRIGGGARTPSMRWPTSPWRRSPRSSCKAPRSWPSRRRSPAGNVLGEYRAGRANKLRPRLRPPMRVRTLNR